MAIHCKYNTWIVYKYVKVGYVWCFCVFVQVSYTRAQNWVQELQKREGPGIVIALAGNKADLNDLRAVEADVTSIFYYCHMQQHHHQQQQQILLLLVLRDSRLCFKLVQMLPVISFLPC